MKYFSIQNYIYIYIYIYVCVCVCVCVRARVYIYAYTYIYIYIYIPSEFESHWVPHSYGLVLHPSKKHSKLLNVI